MELTSSSRGSVRVVSAFGRIDHAHADRFEAALAPYLLDCRKGVESLVLDFSAVSYISSVGLRVLLLAAKQVKEQKGQLVLAALSPDVSEVFQISRFNLVLRVLDSVDAAVAAVAL